MSTTVANNNIINNNNLYKHTVTPITFFSLIVAHLICLHFLMQNIGCLLKSLVET